MLCIGWLILHRIFLQSKRKICELAKQMQQLVLITHLLSYRAWSTKCHGQTALAGHDRWCSMDELP